MSIKNFLSCLLVLGSLTAYSEDEDYSVGRIPPMLFKNSDAVVRLEELKFDIQGAGEAVQYYHYVITILNENGDKWAGFAEYYDKLRSISSVQGYLYDAQGNQLKKMKTKDLVDRSGSDENNLIDDNRVKLHNFYYKSYPYTVEYEIEIKYNSTLFFPMWTPQSGERLSVQKSTATIVCPADYKFRYKAYQYTGEPAVTKEKNKTYSTWTVSNMPAIVREVFQPKLHEITTVVLFGPTEFQVGDYKGNMQSWQDFGKFIYALKQGRDALPDNIKAKVHQLIDGITDEKKKIQVLYEYLQKNTRYISIQLGIGGWQPFDAKFVASKSYGDCKALTNYMYSILKEAGLPSAYTVVRAGENNNYITEDFPSQQFNHVILCVPLKKDTVWLECTSQDAPTGYMGGFTGDRPALLVTETGGSLVRTPSYGLNENLQVRRIEAMLGDDATLKIKAANRYSAIQQDDLHGMINNLSKEKIKEYLHGRFDFPTYNINSFNYTENKSAIPVIEEDLDITVNNYATVTGKRIFIVPNVMTRSYRKLSQDSARKYDIQLGSPYRDIDTVEIELPKGYGIESKPQEVSVSGKFGKYNSSMQLKDNKIYYYRMVEYYGGRFPAKDYSELSEFFETIYKADRNRVVLVKSASAPQKAF